MKHDIAVPVLILIAFAVGCAQEQRVKLIFPQPREKLKADKSEGLRNKQVEWQKARKSYSAETGWTRTSLTLISKKGVVADKPGRTLTLESGQLARLDWSRPNRRGARVEGKRVVSGPSVEFDIYFPTNSPGSCSLSFVSSGAGGRGTLVGADVRAYEVFALKLTLVSINGRSDPVLKQKLVAGAVIGPTAEGRPTGYEPVTLGLTASEKTVTAKTPVSTPEIYEIGFHIHALNHEDWDPSGSRIVLKAGPTEAGQTDPFSSSK
jgi:hypothetical protein